MLYRMANNSSVPSHRLSGRPFSSSKYNPKQSVCEEEWIWATAEVYCMPSFSFTPRYRHLNAGRNMSTSRVQRDWL